MEKITRNGEIPVGMSEIFNNSLEHLLAEMKLIKLRLQLQVMLSRSHKSLMKEDKFRGLYISHGEIDDD